MYGNYSGKSKLQLRKKNNLINSKRNQQPTEQKETTTELTEPR